MLNDILRVEEHINITKLNGQGKTNCPELTNPAMFDVLKKYLTDTLTAAISSGDHRASAAGVRVSNKFTSCDVKHQSRILYRMSDSAE